MTKNPNAFGVAVVSKDDFPAQGYGYTFYSVKYGNTDTGALKRSIGEANTIVQWVDKENNVRISFIEGDIKGVGPMGSVLPTAILLVTCVLVMVVLWRLIKREFSQIGVLYALGFKKGEILRHYLSYPLLMAAAGGLTGAALGLLMVKPFISFISSFYNLPVFAIKINPAVIALGVLLPFLTLLPVALLVINHALRQSPLELLKGGEKQVKIGKLEKAVRLKRLKFETKFKIREILRNVPRTLLMFLGVVCASALLLLGFSMKDSMDDLMQNSFRNTYLYDYVYTFNTLRTGTPETGERVSLAAFRIVGEETEENVMVYGVEPDARLINLTDKNGGRLDHNQTIITQSLADRYQLAAGDVISMQNTLTLERQTMTVGAIARYYLGDYVYIPLSDLNAMLGVPADSYMMLYTDRELSVPSTELISAIDRQYIVDGFNSILKPIRSLSYIIGVISCAIGMIILYVVISLLIEENKDGISMFKVLGYGNKRLYPLILNPYTFLVIIGYAVSIPLVLLSLEQFFAVMTVDMSMSIPAKLTPLSIGVGFVLILLTYQLTKLLNRRKINKINMSESLKTARE